VLVGALLLTGEVRSQTLYEKVVGNLETTGTGSELVATWKLAMSFQTGDFDFRPNPSTGATTFKVSVRVSPDAPDAPAFDGAGYSLYLALDGGGQPGTVMRSFAGLGPLLEPETIELQWTRTDFAPQSRYWVILENAGNYSSAVRWETGGAATGVGSLGSFWLQPAGGSSWSSISGDPGYLQVTASVPEPGGGVLMVLGISVVAAARNRRRNAGQV
jgi:hypothetical protein